jgi:hypothetical protein
VAGNTTNLSVLGADDGGEANLTYSWTTVGSPPAPVTYSANGTNTAKNTTATFTKAGSYLFQATIRDQSNLTVTSSVNVNVNQVLTSIAVSPSSASVATGGTRQFAAAGSDQFGSAFTTQPTFGWSVSGGGATSSSGMFTAGSAAGGPFTITAAAGGKNGTASVTVSATGTQTLSPLADAYVRGGTFAAANYGTASDLQSKTVAGNAQYTRHAYLKFDVGAVSSAITNAKLRLFGTLASAEQIAVQVASVADTSWTETAIVWNNQPAAGASALASVVVNSTSGQWYEWDVTAYVQGEKSAWRNVVSLVLMDPSDSTNYCDFNSREAATNPPQLVVAQ